MRILALETSYLAGSVAVLTDEQLVGQLELDRQQGTARSLAPAIAQQLESANWRPADIDLVAVAQGPGSFTGLRVGVTTAKTLAYAIGAAVVGVNTLEVIAAQATSEAVQIWAVMDAQRQQLFAALFRRCADRRPETIVPTHVVDKEQWLGRLVPQTCVTGPGLADLLDRLPASIAVSDRRTWMPLAGTVGRLAYGYYQAGRRDDVWSLAPNYFRKSAAEENLPQHRHEG